MDKISEPRVEEARHPIQIVSRRTGLSPDVIRVWERRYRAVEPVRSSTNRRLYTDAQIERLALLRRATLAGRSIGDVARLETQELARLVRTDERAAAEVPRAGDVLVRSRQRAHLKSCFEAVDAMDPLRLRMALSGAALEMETTAFLDDVLMPLMTSLGDRWREGSFSVAQEHLTTSIVRTLLESLRDARAGAADGPELLVATPAGQAHELGALMAGVAAASEGWRVTHLGADLPADEVAEGVRRRGAAALALSVVYPEDDGTLPDQLRRLRERLGRGFPIFVGGRAAPAYDPVLQEIGAVRLADLSAFRAELARLRLAR